MNRDEWDRLSRGERDALILNLVYPDRGFSYHDYQLWYYLNGVEEESAEYVTRSLDECRVVEGKIAELNLKDRYIAELTKILIGDNVPDSGDLVEQPWKGKPH